MMQNLSVMDAEIKKELQRKAFHFLSFFYALAYFFIDRGLVLKILGSFLAVEGSIEFGRLLLPGLNQKIVGMFGGIHREEELSRVSGIFWTLAGSFILMAIIPDRTVVFCAMGYLIFGDSAAALVGVPFGTHRFGKNKSVQGSLSFFVVAVVVGLFFFNPFVALLGAAFAAVVECLPLPWNDNFWVPLLSGLFLLLIR